MERAIGGCDLWLVGCGHLPPDLVFLCPWSLNLDNYKEILFQKIFGLKQKERNSLKVPPKSSHMRLPLNDFKAFRAKA